jgi:hypothetical protein
VRELSDHGAEDRFWAAIREHAAGKCVTYGPGELAAFAEGKLRPAYARTIEAHLALCGDCRAIVQELRKELAATQTVYRAAPVRPAPRVWKWALGPVAVTAAVLIVMLVFGRLPGPAPRPGPGLGGGTTIAQKPTTPAPALREKAVAKPQPPAGPAAAEGNPPSEEAPAPGPAHRHHRPAGRGQAQPAPEERQVPGELPPGPEQVIAGTPAAINPLPTVLSFADRHLEKVYRSEAKIDPAAHPELLNDLETAKRSLRPRQAPAEEKLFVNPGNDLPRAQPTRPAEGELFK